MLKLIGGRGPRRWGSSPRPAHAKPSTFTRGPCPVDAGVLAPRLTCGILEVDETRGSNNGRRVAMPVAIIKAEKPTGQPPVIYLHGGPGGGAVASLAARPGGGPRPQRAWTGHDQDVVMFDQRGGTASVPALDCGGLNLNDAGPDSDGTVGALKACAARHKAAGVDLSRYNAVEVAHDVQDLRRLLGYKQVDLFGVSYGTRIALEVVRTAPEGVRAVVLDSLWPPEAKWVDEGPMPVARAVRQILALCAADPACAKDKPDLQAKVDALAVRWLAAPQGGSDGKRYPVEDFAQYMMDAAYSGEDAREMPAVMQKLVSGDFSPIAAHDTDRSPYAEAQHLTHLCKEQFPFETRAGVGDERGLRPAGAGAGEDHGPLLRRLRGLRCRPDRPAPGRPRRQRPADPDRQRRHRPRLPARAGAGGVEAHDVTASSCSCPRSHTARPATAPAPPPSRRASCATLASRWIRRA